MSRTIRKTIDHVLYEVWLNVAAPTPIGMAGRTVGAVFNRDVPVQIDFSYSPAEKPGADDPGAPAEVAIRSITLAGDVMFYGEKMKLALDAGFDLMEVLPEIEVEKLEEMIIQRAEAKWTDK
jgi:hypothetical protein